jgi:hypothetical protein
MKTKTKPVKRRRKLTLSGTATAKLPTVRRAKYKVGDKVYSSKNRDVKRPIAECRALIDDAAPINVYRLLLSMINGKPTYSDWISELTISTVKAKKVVTKSKKK